MAQLSFNCFQNKKMLGLYLSYSLTADIPISVTHVTLIKHYFQQNREKKLTQIMTMNVPSKLWIKLHCIKYPIKNLTIWPGAIQWSLWLYIHVYDILLANKNSHRNNDFCNAQNNFNRLPFSPFYFYQFDKYLTKLSSSSAL